MRSANHWLAKKGRVGRFGAFAASFALLFFAAISDATAQSNVWSRARSARNASVPSSNVSPSEFSSVPAVQTVPSVSLAPDVSNDFAFGSASVSSAPQTTSARGVSTPSSLGDGRSRVENVSPGVDSPNRRNAQSSQNALNLSNERDAQTVRRSRPTTVLPTGGERLGPEYDDFQARARDASATPASVESSDSRIGEPIARRVSKAAASAIAAASAPRGVYYAVLPRANLLKEAPQPESESETNAGGEPSRGDSKSDLRDALSVPPSVPEGSGLDARVDSAVSSNPRLEAPEAENSVSPEGASASAANVDDGSETLEPYLESEENAAPDDAIVFTLTNVPPDELVLLRDAADGRWDKMDLFNAALIAEGLTTRARRAPYRQKFERCVSEILTESSSVPDALGKAEIAYRYMHRNVLTADYNLNCSSLVASFDSGVFNCVSATTLFNCLASRIGLDVAALETVGHAKSRIKFGDSFLDVETTCSDWSRLPDGLRKYPESAKHSVARPVVGSNGVASRLGSEAGGGTVSVGRVNLDGSKTNRDDAPFDSRAIEGTTTFEDRPDAPLGFSFTRNRRPMREIDEVELIATIYYNVGVELYQQERFEEAVAAYVKAARLAPNNLTVLGNLKATLNNWAVQIAVKERDFARAVDITEQGLAIDPNFAEYRQNLPIFYRRWTSFLAKENRWDDVERVRALFYRRFPEEERRERELNGNGN